jgi:hypothetical protein
MHVKVTRSWDSAPTSNGVDPTINSNGKRFICNVTKGNSNNICQIKNKPTY